MDFLFDNPLANFYGPYFLIFYVLFAVITIVGFRVVRNSADETKNFNVPPVPTNPDAFEIAYLRGGANELARTVVFALARKNLLNIINEDKISRICPTDNGFERRRLQPIELTALEWFDANRQPSELFQIGGLADKIQPFYETYQAQLEMQRFVPDAAMKSRNQQLAFQAFLIFGSLGAYKFLASLYNGYTNIIGIVFITIGAAFVLSGAARMPRLTALGSEYLKRLQIAFERVKPSSHLSAATTGFAPAATFGAVDPFLLSVGVFGGAALAGTVYDEYNTAFQKAQNASVGGSCGSGCGSYSSSGSGCGSGDGGSSCGGGCGGGD